MKRPNILILLTDQQRWDTLHCNGNDLISTPNLDSLAERGVTFTNAYCNCPVCMPSRMSLLTGRYPASLGIRCNGIELPEDTQCLQHILSLYGYTTANLGKLHFKNHASQFRDHREPHPKYGFDRLILSDEPGCYDDAYIKWVERKAPDQVAKCRCDTPPAWTGEKISIHPRGTHTPYVFAGDENLTHSAFVADETATFIRQTNEPFFAIAGFYAPHCPINPPQRFVDMYDPDDMPLPQRNPGQNYHDVSDEQWRKVKAYYYALISHVDDQIGRILEALRESGKMEDTIIIFTADHGEHLGDHGLVGKGAPFDSCTRVPLIISAPSHFPQRGQSTAFVELVDLAPTILDFAGIQTPPEMQGRSLHAFLQGTTTKHREHAFIEHAFPGTNQAYKALRTEEHLYVINAEGHETLYDLNEDPHQLHDVAPGCDRTSILSECRHLLLQRWFEAERRGPFRTGMY
ncbi:MAG: DUF229 domain-containing protein [Lentisphaerae bacterium]|nr:MAG: DUF229 domain-containing protein [Lentisphaerota bacterium]